MDFEDRYLVGMIGKALANMQSPVNTKLHELSCRMCERAEADKIATIIAEAKLRERLNKRPEDYP